MPDTMPIGTDIDLLCEAVTLAASQPYLSQNEMRWRLRIGAVRAHRLHHVLEDLGVIEHAPITGERGRWMSRATLITQRRCRKFWPGSVRQSARRRVVADKPWRWPFVVGDKVTCRGNWGPLVTDLRVHSDRNPGAVYGSWLCARCDVPMERPQEASCDA